MAVKQFQQDEVIFQQGEEGSVFYQIVEGSVGIFVSYDGKDIMKLRELGKGQIFGEMALIDAAPRSATAIALESGTQVTEVSVDELNSYFENNPDNITSLMKTLSGRLRDLSADYKDAEETAEQLKIGKPEEDEAFFRAMRKYNYFHKIQPNYKASAETVREEEKDHSSGFAKNVVTYPRGTVICREGDLVSCMYDIHWGRVGIYSHFGMPDQVQLSTLAANNFFGEMGMVENAPRSATAVALDDDTTVEIIYPEDLADLFKKNPGKVDMILQDLSKKLRTLTARYYDICEKICAFQNQ